ncbi:hypothetical protein PMAYCL1PPCAC_16931, partial [Pristionchus mayeri]
RFGTILCVSPFLTLAIAVDHAFLFANGWQQIVSRRRNEDLSTTTPKEELILRTKMLLIETGPSVTITTITNSIAFIISTMSGAPELVLFSIGNGISVIVVFFFEFTVFVAVIVITARPEIENEFKAMRESPTVSEQSVEKAPNPLDLSARVDQICFENRKPRPVTVILKKMLRVYCKFLCNKVCVTIVMICLAAYLAWSTMETMRMRVSLKPEKLFLGDSSFIKLFSDRQAYIQPSYDVLWIHVFNPGNIWEPKRRVLIDSMIHDFESLSHSVGRYSTKLFLRDFEEYLKENPEALTSMDYDSDGGAGKSTTKYEQLQSFLSDAQYSYWKGFMQFEPEEKIVNGSEPAITRFLFTTAYKGQDQLDWINRVALLKQWRDIANNEAYSSLNVTVYQEDAKFLDIVDTMVPQTYQSALLTLVSMCAVAWLFIKSPNVLFTAAFTIVSTSLGSVGIISWLGEELDPTLMCAIILVIGFSVDIPAHIAYHYHQTDATHDEVFDRLEHSIERIGFPIAEACVSTTICVASLFFVDLHMAHTFAVTMVIVVVVGAIHGIFVMPAMFSASAHLSHWIRSCCCRSRVAASDTVEPIQMKGVEPIQNSFGPNGTTTISVQ